MSAEHTRALVDHDRTACLCSDGLPGYWAAVCVTASGDDVLWLVCVDELDAEHPRHGNGDQPHEQPGRLPASWRRRILGDPRCGAPTHNGRPCRMRVANHGDVCAVHSKPRCGGCGQIMFHQGGVWGCFGCDPERYWTPQQQVGGAQ
ncbi:hypothetical protein [Mycobacterium marseillense]|uniref:Uncharacterized protein n=1 Tax=Mycobacterium marseillense TaxID=701042 RepID=A0ABM7JAS6_9MYCO|nr:hypothetical protein [Mycobacterium marseillense]MCV7404510.1 hypothetical protein [Mycobacterium marseillense]ORA89775.1 hypothetical protein BST31_17525 [Mycobacterium marseillense]BBY11000.1 hypothetical protein MMARJ_17400 [Mycobacterium marseillense]